MAVLALAVIVVLSLAYGTKSVGVADVWGALWHFDPDVGNQVIVRDMRLPRTQLGIIVGMALGLAGAVMQGVTRNPLADPGILGVQAGASLAVVIGISTFGVSTYFGYTWFAFAGAAVASVVVYAIGSMGRGGATPVKLALAGAAMTALLTSLTTTILLLDLSTLDEYRFWAVGSLLGRDDSVALQVLPFFLAGLVLALLSARSLNLLALGDDVARALGQRVGAARAVSALCVVLLCGSAVAAAGPIGFIGLTVPHIARAICGPDYRWVLPWSMVLAPILLLGSDVIGRLVLPSSELQVGIVTAVLGAPFFIALVRRRKLAEL